MRIQQWLVRRAEKTTFGRRIVHERRYRMVLSAAFGFCLNLLYALYHGVLGIYSQSIWFLSMFAYYVILGAVRFSAVLCERKNSVAASDGIEYFVLTLSGILLTVLSFVLSGVIYLSLSQNIVTKYDSILMITIATYTFYKITMAVVRAVKQRHDPSPLLAAIRSIGYAEVAASVLTMQRSMLVSFEGMTEEKIHLMNSLTGAVVCLFVLVLGIAMIIKSTKRKEPSEWQNQNL